MWSEMSLNLKKKTETLFAVVMLRDLCKSVKGFLP